jgi:hypothetical protein
VQARDSGALAGEHFFSVFLVLFIFVQKTTKKPANPCPTGPLRTGIKQIPDRY